MHWSLGIYVVAFLAGAVAGSVLHALRTALRVVEGD